MHVEVFADADSGTDTDAQPVALRDRHMRDVFAFDRTLMTTLRQAAEEFLTQSRIAVAGVSRDGGQPANMIYRRLRDAGHEVFAVNPNAEEVEGDSSYAAVTAIAAGVDGVVIVTSPKDAGVVAADCVSAGVPRVWFHRGIGPGSVSEDAIAYCHDHGVSVIPGGCPNMFGATSDAGHRCLGSMLRLTGKIPAQISVADYPRVSSASV